MLAFAKNARMKAEIAAAAGPGHAAVAPHPLRDPPGAYRGVVLVVQKTGVRVGGGPGEGTAKEEVFIAGLCRETDVPFIRVMFGSTFCVHERGTGGAMAPHGEFHTPDLPSAPVLGSIALPCVLGPVAAGVGTPKLLAARSVPHGKRFHPNALLKLYDSGYYPIVVVEGAIAPGPDCFEPALQDAMPFRFGTGTCIVVCASGAADRAPGDVLKNIDQSAASALMGPGCVRACAVGGEIYAMAPTTPRALAAVYSGTPHDALNDSEPPRITDGLRALIMRIKEGRATYPAGPVYDRTRPRFYVGPPGAPPQALEPKNVCDFVAGLGPEGGEVLGDLLDQCALGLSPPEHERLMSGLTKTVLALMTVNPEPIDLDEIEARARAAVAAEPAASPAVTELRVATARQRLLRERVEARRGAKTRLKKEYGHIAGLVEASVSLSYVTRNRGTDVKMEKKGLVHRQRQRLAAANVAAAAMGEEEIADFFDEHCRAGGVVAVRLAPAPFLQCLGEVSRGAHPAGMHPPLPPEGAPPQLLDGLTGGVLVGMEGMKVAAPADADHHPLLLQDTGTVHCSMLINDPSPGGRGNTALVIPAPDLIVKQRKPWEIDWLSCTNNEVIACFRIWTVSSITGTRAGREQGLTIAATSPAARRLLALICLESARRLGESLQPVVFSGPGGGRPGGGGRLAVVAAEAFDDSARAAVRGLIGTAVMALMAGADPDSMVCELFYRMAARPALPRNTDDWGWYARVATIIEHGCWNPANARRNVWRILLRGLNSRLRAFIRQADTQTVKDCDRYWASNLWLCKALGLGGNKITTKCARLVRGGYLGQSRRWANIAAALVDLDPVCVPYIEDAQSVPAIAEGLERMAGAEPGYKEIDTVAVMEECHRQSGRYPFDPHTAGPVNFPQLARGPPAAGAGGAAAPTGLAVTDNEAVREVLLASGTTEREMREICESSGVLVRLAEAEDIPALESVATLIRIRVPDFMELARFASPGHTPRELRATFRRLTEFLFAMRGRAPANAEEQTFLSLAEERLG